MSMAQLLLVIRILSMGFFLGSVVLAVWQQEHVWYGLVAFASMIIYLSACLGESVYGDE